MSMVTAFVAGLAVWLAVPAPVLGRMGGSTLPTLPGWARPVPGAPGIRTRACAGVLVGVAVVGLSGWPLPLAVPIGAVGAAATVIAAGRLESSGHRRVVERRQVELPDTLMLLAGALDAGIPLRSAVSHVGTALGGVCGDDLAGVHGRVVAGLSDAQAWRALAAVPGWQDAARDVARAVDSGEGVAELLTAHAEQLRREAAEEAEKRARKAGVDAILPLAVCHLPAFLLVGVVPIVAGTVMQAL